MPRRCASSSMLVLQVVALSRFVVLSRFSRALGPTGVLAPVDWVRNPRNFTGPLLLTLWVPIDDGVNDGFDATLWETDGIGRQTRALREVPTPSPKPGEVLVETAAVALNYRDKMVIDSGQGLPLQFPFTPGSDLAGQVVAVGDGVTRFDVGDKVSFQPT